MVAFPVSAPLSTVNEPLGFTVNGPFSVSVWPASESVTVPAPFVPRIIPPTVGLMSKVTVTPALVMMAVSVAPGTWLGFQLVAVFQPPLAVLVQLMVATSAKRPARATQPIAVARRMIFMVFVAFYVVIEPLLVALPP